MFVFGMYDERTFGFIHELFHSNCHQVSSTWKTTVRSLMSSNLRNGGIFSVTLIGSSKSCIS